MIEQKKRERCRTVEERKRVKRGRERQKE